ncbi:MAG: site-2 protease family protein [archaeon]|nr:site-2 protease family protein [archaeon]
MNFIVLDIILLVAFCIFLSVFLYVKRKNVKREGLLFLYKTSWGMKIIDYVGGKYKRTLNFFSYIIVFSGYLLMAGVLYMVGQLIYIYAAMPDVARAVKVPPIMPLIPYLPQMFKLDFLPPFYFTYWIVILVIIAVSHEFAHGIYSKLYGVRVKSTGFGFLGPFLAAFVETDEKKMAKKPKFQQMAILGAGTFANVITSVLFFIILIIFFAFSFSASGVVFDTYAYSAVAVSNISSINGITANNQNYTSMIDQIEGISEVEANNKTYLTTREMFQKQEKNQGYIILYDDSPAVRAELIGAITEINNNKITSRDDLRNELAKYKPGDNITITTKINDTSKKYEVTLLASPGNETLPWLGIGFYETTQKGIISKTYLKLSSYFKEPHVYYEPKYEASVFIYNLLWWIILISVSVALVNMLPVGIFDGGRFFYLTMFGIFKNEKIASKIFHFVTYLFLFIILLLMVLWFFAI